MKIFLYTIVISISLFFTCCTDEEHVLSEKGNPSTGNVRFTIHTSDITLTTPSTTRGISESEMDLDGIDRYQVLFYDENGNFKYTFERINSNYVAGETTQSYETTYNVPVGRYKVYVIANLENPITVTTTDGVTTVSTPHGDDITTVDNLKKAKFDWYSTKDENTVEEHKRIMFGFFTKVENDGGYEDNEPNDDVTKLENDIDTDIREWGVNNVNPTDYDAPVIEITDDNIQAHLTAKVYRMASLISLYFDTYEMNKEVKIVVHKISLKNIPKSCYLWSENTPSSDELLEDDIEIEDFVINKDIEIKRKTGTIGTDGFDTGRNEYVNNNQIMPYFFYLFENRQGLDKDNTDGSVKYKLLTNKPQATYLEIEATHSVNGENERKVTYRYPIGEDGRTYITGEGDSKALNYYENIHFNNYNITRNRHYKVYLTLKNNGIAGGTTDDVTWRIVMDDSHSFVPYTSYNPKEQTAALLDIDADAIYKLDSWKIKAKSWKPSDNKDWLNISIDGTSYTDAATGVSGTGDVKINYQTTDGDPNVSRKVNLGVYKEDNTEVKSFAIKQVKLDGYAKSHKDETMISYTDFVEFQETLKIWITAPDNSTNVSTGNCFTENNLQLESFIVGEKASTTTGDEIQYTINFKPQDKENGYKILKLYSEGYLPKEIKIYRNAPLTIKDPVAEAVFENKNIKNITDTKFKLVKDAEDTGSQYVTSVAPYIPSIIVDKNETKTTTSYPYCFNIKNNNTYIEFTFDRERTLNVVGRGRYESGNGYEIFKVVDGTETSIQKVSMPPSNHIRNYTTTLDAGTYRIKKTSGEIYLYYLALN